MFKKGLLTVAITTVLAGCGGSNDDGPKVITQTGQFVDSAVAGLNYSTATQTGVTNADGEFEYLEGEIVTFSIGGFELPAVDTSELKSGVVTPLNMGDSYSIDDDKVVAIARLLQSFDDDGDATNGISLGDAAEVLSADDLNLDNLPDDLVGAFGAPNNITAEDAKKHFEETLNSPEFKEEIIQPSIALGMWSAINSSTTTDNNVDLGPSVVTFLFQADGTYTFNQSMTNSTCNDFVGSNEYDWDFSCGTQKGTYKFEDGSITFLTTTYDSNGSWGPAEGMSLDVIGNELVYTPEKGEQIKWSEVTHADNDPLAGSWKIRDSDNQLAAYLYIFDIVVDNNVTTYWTFNEAGAETGEMFQVDFGGCDDSECSPQLEPLYDTNGNGGLYDLGAGLNNFDRIKLTAEGQYAFEFTEDDVTSTYNLVRFN
jgi:hypothetical protein